MLSDGFVPALASYSLAQDGVVTRRQARACGYDDAQILRLTRPGGPWHTVRRGAYCLESMWVASTMDERSWLGDLAAHLTMSTPHLLSHDSAARALRLPMLQPRRMLVHVTRPGVGGSRTEHGVKHHLARVPPPSRTVVRGIEVTGLARTGLDIAREHGLAAGVVVLDACRQRGMSDRDAIAELALMRSWPGVRTARAAFALSDGRSESPGESLMRLLVHELGIGEPWPQFAVALPAGTAWCDLVVGRHVFEFDGRVKYLHERDGGVSDDPARAIWAEKLRERDIAALGLGVSRVTWDDVLGPGREAARRRLLGEFRLTCQRFGDQLPESLVAFARKHPRRAA